MMQRTQIAPAVRGWSAVSLPCILPLVVLVVVLPLCSVVCASLAVVEVNCTTSSNSPLTLRSNTAYYLRNCTRQQMFKTPSGTPSIENVAVIAVGGTVQPFVEISCDSSVTNVSIELIEVSSVSSDSGTWLSITAPTLVKGVRFSMDRVVAKNKRGTMVALSFGDHMEDVHIVGNHCDIDFTTASTIALFGLFGKGNENTLRNVSIAMHGGQWRVQTGSSTRRQGWFKIYEAAVIQHVAIVLDDGVSLEMRIPTAYATLVDSMFTGFHIEHRDQGAAANALQLLEHVAINFTNVVYRGIVEGAASAILMDIRLVNIDGEDSTLNNVKFTAYRMHAVIVGANQGYVLEFITWASIAQVSVDVRDVYFSVTPYGNIKSSGARTGALVAVLQIQRLTAMDVRLHNVTMDVKISHIRPLASYFATTGAVMVMQRAALVTQLTVGLSAVVMTAVVDEATKGLIVNGGFGVGQHATTISLLVIASAALENFRFASIASHVTANVTVVAPDLSSVVFVMQDYVAVSIGTIALQANCTHCVVSIDRCDVLVTELRILAPPGYTNPIHYDDIVCSMLSVFNVSSFVIGLDSSPIAVQCLSAASGLNLLPSSAYQPTHFSHVVVEVLNSRLMAAALAGDRSSSEADGPWALMAFGPPGYSTNVSVLLSNVSAGVAVYVEGSGGGGGTTGLSLSSSHDSSWTSASLIVFVKSSVTSGAMTVRGCSGFQHLLYATAGHASAVTASSIAVQNSSFAAGSATNADRRRVSLFDGSSTVTLGSGVDAAVGSSTFSGLHTLFGRFIAFEPPPPASSPSPTQGETGSASRSASYLLGCNAWDLLPTTPTVYRNITFDAADRNYSAAFDAHLHLLNLSQACPLPPTPQPFVAPAPPPAVASRAAAAVGVAAMSVAGAIPTIGAAPNLVRLQTSMTALKIRDSCNGSKVVYGTSVFENPTQVAVDGGGVGEDYRYAAGAVLMNVVLVVAVTGFMSMCRQVDPATSLWRRCRRRKDLDDADTAVCAGHLFWSWAVWYRRVGLWLRYAPGSGAVVLAILLQPSVVSSVALLSSGGAAEVLIGLVGLAVFVGGVVAASCHILWAFPLVYYVPEAAVAAPLDPQTGRQPQTASSWNRSPSSYMNDGAALTVESFPPAPSRSQSSLWRRCCELCLPLATTASEWRSPHSKSRRRASSSSSSSRQVHRRFFNRYSAFFDSYRGGRHWYFALELGIAVCCGLVSGISGVGIPCSAALWLLVGLCGAGTLFAVVLLPSAVPLHNAFGVVVNVLGFSACLLIVVNLDEAAEMVAILQIALSMAAAAVDAAAWVVTAAVRRRSNRRDSEASSPGRSLFPSLSAVLAVGGTERFQRMALLERLNQQTPEANLQVLIRRICNTGATS